MPETYGLPEPELTRAEAARRILNEIIAGQGVVRRVVLYVLVALGITLTASPLVWLVWLGGALAFVCLILLMATDGALA